MADFEWWEVAVTVVCIVLSGTFSGLTLGLMSLDIIDLRVISESGSDHEKWCARKILPVRRHGNFLLCTLLIGNTAVNSALSIVTANLFGGIVGFVSSTIAILYIGEIIPQAICHRYGLFIGAYAIHLVKFFMFLTGIISYPTSKVLDWVLGGEPVTRYNKNQLRSLLNIHGAERATPADDRSNDDFSGSDLEKGMGPEYPAEYVDAIGSADLKSAGSDRDGNSLETSDTSGETRERTTQSHASQSKPAHDMVGSATGSATDVDDDIEEDFDADSSVEHPDSAGAGDGVPNVPRPTRAVFRSASTSGHSEPAATDPASSDSTQSPTRPRNGTAAATSERAARRPRAVFSVFQRQRIPSSTGDEEPDDDGHDAQGRRARAVAAGGASNTSTPGRANAPTRGRRKRDGKGARDRDRDAGRDKKDAGGDRKPLTVNEVTMLGGAFDFSQKKVSEVMTALSSVFMLEANASFDFKTLLIIFQTGHSRVPVYEGDRSNIIGVVFAKDLILLDPEDNVPIKTVLVFFKRRLLVVPDTTTLDEMLNIFKSGGGHLALVQKVHNKGTPGETRGTLGVVTLEDLIEALIGQEIVDETDVYVDNSDRRRPVHRSRYVDPEILKMLDSKTAQEHHRLSEKEVRVVSAYLSSNFPPFSTVHVQPQVLQDLLAEARLIVYSELRDEHDGDHWGENDGRAPGAASGPDGQPLVHGTESSSVDPVSSTDPATHPMGHYYGVTASEVLAASPTSESHVTVYKRGVPTQDAYLVIHGRLEVTAGDDGFVSEAGPWTMLGMRALTEDLYAPDFTARVSERPARLLHIPRRTYRRMVRYSSGSAPGSSTGPFELGSGMEPGASSDSISFVATSAQTARGVSPLETNPPIVAASSATARVKSNGRDLEWKELGVDAAVPSGGGTPERTRLSRSTNPGSSLDEGDLAVGSPMNRSRASINRL